MLKIPFMLSSLALFSTIGWATPPCAPVVQACVDAGFYKGGNVVGKGLISNCVIPILNKQKVVPDVAFDDNTLRLCEVQLRELKSQTH